METLMAIIVAMLSGAPAPAGHSHAAVEQQMLVQPAPSQNAMDVCEPKGGDAKSSTPCAALRKKRQYASAQRNRARACAREAAGKHLKGYDKVEFIASCIDSKGPA